MNLVTGGNGFIGSHIVRHLRAEDKPTRVYDRVESATRALPGVESIVGDIQHPEALARAVAGCTRIFHQAALVSVPESVANPRACHEINTTGTLNVLLAARDTGVRRVVAASSSAVYGNDPAIPKTETMLPAPVSPYAASKLATEELCATVYHTYGLETVAPSPSPTTQHTRHLPRPMTNQEQMRCAASKRHIGGKAWRALVSASLAVHG